MKWIMIGALMVVGLAGVTVASAAGGVDTGQNYCYDASNRPIACPQPGETYFGQDGNYRSTQPAYQDNGDGTISDLSTGLMWVQNPAEKVTWSAAMANAASVNVGGYTDWRMPTLKELYSLINFNGVTGMSASASTPYLDTNYFHFDYGDENAGERVIDAQYWSSTEYVSLTMNGNHTVFGVNFADGRIKGYGTADPRGREMLQFARYVRGESAYGTNAFINNGDGTITDQISGLMWMQDDSANGMNWADALAYCENMSFAGYDDWRLPNAKELQGIVDYSRSPDTTNSAAIDPLFNATVITNSEGQPDYAYYWTGTTHLDGPDFGVYVAFGRAQGYMDFQGGTNYQLLDVHGAGAQRSDPKSGDPADYPVGNGPQGDVIRIYNLARCVRGGDVDIFTGGDPSQAPLPPVSGQPPQGNAQGQPPQDNGQGQPPQEAINACTGLTAGAACSFTTPQGVLNGSCENLGNVTACVPQGAPPR